MNDPVEPTGDFVFDDDRSNKDIILCVIDDLATDFLYYDREEATQYPKTGDIEKAIAAGEVTLDEMVEKFREALIAGIRP